jgi:TonB family protein
MQRERRFRVAAAFHPRREITMNTPLRFVTIAGTLTLALSSVAAAATVRLVPLGERTVGASVHACAVPSAAASVAAAELAELPVIAAEQQRTGIVAVRIDLDPRGTLARASVLDSSGNRWIDLAALRAARLSRYSAEVRDCERVGGAYAFIVDFTR